MPHLRVGVQHLVVRTSPREMVLAENPSMATPLRTRILRWASWAIRDALEEGVLIW